MTLGAASGAMARVGERRRLAVGIAVLSILVLFSAAAVIYAKFQNRMLYAELQRLQREHDRMLVQWDRLQLEESAFATHGRIEELARERLGMDWVAPDDIVYVRP